jgi:thiol-disulfide isomerase/thioredoxin
MNVAAWVLLGLLAVLQSEVPAAELQPFVAGSMQQIRSAHADQPFVLMLWSITCSHCQEELARLGSLQRQHPELKIILVSTDTPDDAEAIRTLLARHGLARTEAWVYADEFVERLRFAIDPRWGGELPRSYFFDHRHRVTAHSGALTLAQLQRWAVAATPPKTTP